MRILPVILDDLIHARAVESVRRDFKKTWNTPIKESTLRSICAFANDLQGMNGGYIILGIEEDGGLPVLPPHGLEGVNIDSAQRELRGACKRIDPEYQPVLAPETYMGRSILVVWAPVGDVRPYQAPESTAKGAARKYYVHVGSETVEAQGELLNQLLSLTARVSFDDRRRTDVPLSAVSWLLIEKFLRDVGSDLTRLDDGRNVETVLRALRMTAGTNGTEAPRNVALLFFTDDPAPYFASARVYIELAQFGDDSGGDLIESRTFRGPLPRQIYNTLEYLEGLSTEMIRKVPGQIEALRSVAFPHEALREAIVNAVYHRGYDGPDTPIRIAMYPDRLEITSHPGPVPGLRLEHLRKSHTPPQLPARNPRVGDLLKSLRLAETWHTGIPKIRRRMEENGSPEPVFEFDDARTYFRVILPAHPGYVVLHSLRQAAELWHTGERRRAVDRLSAVRERVSGSGALTAQLIEYAAALGDLPQARDALRRLELERTATDRHLAYLALARAYLDAGDQTAARTLLGNLPHPRDVSDVVDLAILHKRSGEMKVAHRLFKSVEGDISREPRALHEFAQTKIHVARAIPTRSPQDREAKRRLYQEAQELIHRVIALAPDQPTRSAWAWFDLARVLAALKEPEGRIQDALERARDLLPEERRFLEWLENHRSGGPGA